MSAPPPFRLPGWAAKASVAPVLVSYKGDDEQSRVTLDGKAMLFGRKVENAPERGTMRLDHDSISREHAVIVHAFQGESFVCDLGSRYGTKLNGTLLKPKAYTTLPEAAELRFGESSRHYKFFRRPPPPPGKSSRSDSKAGKAAAPTAKAAPASSKRAEGGSSAADQVEAEEEDPMANYQDDDDDESSDSDDEEDAQKGGADGSAELVTLAVVAITFAPALR